MKKALFIGINYVGNTEAQLNGCIDDVTNMMTIITTYYGYEPNNIVMLTDASSSTVDTMPTKANILQALQDLVNGSADCEEMWIHYSGHGAVVSSYNGSAIVPVDYVTEGLITDMDLYDLIRSIRCKTMILMDSCNSGSMCNLEWNYEYLYGLNFMRTQLNSQQIVNPEIYMISGSKSNQPSAEIYDTESKEYGLVRLLDLQASWTSQLYPDRTKTALAALAQRGLNATLMGKTSLGVPSKLVINADTASPSIEFREAHKCATL